MEEIQLGEYVRTNEGIIDKVKDFSNDTSFYHCENGMIIDVYSKCATYLKDIVKHSFYKTDIIGLGDFVNGKEVVEIITCGEKRTPIINNFYRNSRRKIELQEKDIKSIVTKEQFESISYKVGE